MAKRNSKGRFVKGGSRVTTRTVRGSTKIIRVNASPPVHHRRRTVHRSGFGFGGTGASSLLSHALGGAAYGYAIRQGWVEKLPALPVIGRTGAAALFLHWAGGKTGGSIGELMRSTSKAAATIAGYQLGSGGAVVGDDGVAAGFSDPVDGDGDGY